MINWNRLNGIEQLKEIKDKSSELPVMIFKHSTRCPTSSMALSRLERSWSSDAEQKLVPYYLDLISYREISNEVASAFGVQHESPQVLIIKEGACSYDASHLMINYNEIMEKVAE